MSSFFSRLLPQLAPWLALLFASAPSLPAQQQQQGQQTPPHLGYIYPAGGQKGTTFKVIIGGQYFEGIHSILVSGGGFKATLVDQFKPISNREAQMLREERDKLQEKRKAAEKAGGKPPFLTAEEQQRGEEIRKKLAMFVRRPPNPSITETATFEVTLSPDAQPGERELRIATRGGVSNPLGFQVSTLKEFSQEKPKSDRIPGEQRPEYRQLPDLKVSMPCVINGQILPGAADHIRFSAKQGQQIVIATFARALIPYLADAVPGWFQATLTLRDASGKELAYDDDYKFNPDPVLFYRIPTDGDYVVEIKDSIFRGREDFVYRIYLGELPFVTSVFPLGAQVDKATTAEIRGWNLPADRMTPTVTNPGLHQLVLRAGILVPNRISFMGDSLPELIESPTGVVSKGPVPVTLPLIINGHIDQAGQWDVFSFEGKAGQIVVAEIMARRLDSPLDSVLKITKASGEQIAFNDDHEDKGSGLNTHHADSYLRCKLPADGTYLAHVGDIQSQGGKEYSYRLRLSAPQPDYSLRVSPASLNLRAGATTVLSVFALRRDGFDGEIALTLRSSPAGFRLAGAVIPKGADQVRVTLTAPYIAPSEPFPISIDGSSVIDGKLVLREAVPSENMMQAFAYRHLVPAKQLLVDVRGRIQQRSQFQITGKTPVLLPIGGTAELKVNVPKDVPLGKLRLELSDPPEGVTIEEITGTWTGSVIHFKVDAAKAKPGTAGNLIVDVLLDRTPGEKKAKAKAANTQAIPVDTLPAIPFLITKP
jgi:hypothetical protein